MEEVICGVYSIKNTKTNISYIGSSKNVTNRWRVHVWRLKTNSHPNKELQESFNKHKLSDFSFTILERCSEVELRDVEHKYISKIGLSMLFNRVEDTKGGGAEVNRKKLILFDTIDGTVLYFDSGVDLNKYINTFKKSPQIQLNYRYVNKIAKLRKRFVFFTVEYYEKNKDFIDNHIEYIKSKWKPVVKKQKPKYDLMYKGIEYKSITSLEVIKIIGTNIKVFYMYKTEINKNGIYVSNRNKFTIKVSE